MKFNIWKYSYSDLQLVYKIYIKLKIVEQVYNREIVVVYLHILMVSGVLTELKRSKQEIGF